MALAQAGTNAYHVVAYDYGSRPISLRLLVDRGCRVTLVPAQTPVEDVLALKPDGIFLSNGPGDPEPCDYAIETCKAALDKKIRYFGICLGQQIIGSGAWRKDHQNENRTSRRQSSGSRARHRAGLHY